jgi:hypothetical protein
MRASKSFYEWYTSSLCLTIHRSNHGEQFALGTVAGRGQGGDGDLGRMVPFQVSVLRMCYKFRFKKKKKKKCCECVRGDVKETTLLSLLYLVTRPHSIAPLFVNKTKSQRSGRTFMYPVTPHSVHGILLKSNVERWRQACQLRLSPDVL